MININVYKDDYNGAAYEMSGFRGVCFWTLIFKVPHKQLLFVRIKLGESITVTTCPGVLTGYVHL